VKVDEDRMFDGKGDVERLKRGDDDKFRKK
jgi:hypothetical protein